MYFNGTYLRVLTPRTTNGMIPKTVNGEVQYRETLLPLSAKKQMEKKNARLTKHGFKHLVSIIEEVGTEPVKPKAVKPESAPNPQPLTKEPVVRKRASKKDNL